MELDYSGGDDTVKTYKGVFTGRALTDVYVKTTNIHGKIEGDGDAQAELYLLFRVDKMPKDKSGSVVPEGLFQYRLGIN